MTKGGKRRFILIITFIVAFIIDGLASYFDFAFKFQMHILFVIVCIAVMILGYLDFIVGKEDDEDDHRYF